MIPQNEEARALSLNWSTNRMRKIHPMHSGVPTQAVVYEGKVKFRETKRRSGKAFRRLRASTLDFDERKLARPSHNENG